MAHGTAVIMIARFLLCASDDWLSVLDICTVVGGGGACNNVEDTHFRQCH